MTTVMDVQEEIVVDAGGGVPRATAEDLLARVLDDETVAALAEQARGQGVALVGEGGLLQQLTKRFLEAALDGEMDAHLGRGRHERGGAGNARNGKRAKTLITEVGPVVVEVPRDRDGSFTPTIVGKRQRRFGGLDNLVISLTAKGLTTGEVVAHLAEVYGTETSKETISTITDRVLDSFAEWQSRPLDPVYPVIFIDCIHVKIRDGQVANRPVYVALAVTCDGGRDILGLWAGDGGEGAKYWLRVLTELRNRGVRDVCIVVCDGLKGLPDAIGETWPAAITQTCIVHYSEPAIMPIPGSPGLVSGGGSGRGFGIITVLRGRRGAGRWVGSGRVGCRVAWSGRVLAV